VTVEGAPEAVATSILDVQTALKEAVPWYSDMGSSVRLGLAGMLVRTGDDVSSFLDALEVAQARFREVHLRRSAANEAFATLIHRQLTGRREVTIHDAQRLKAIYEALKGYHWWLTGPEDLASCVVLSSRSGEPQTIGTEVEAIFQALRQAGHSGGEPLQTASFFLTLAEGHPSVLAKRFTWLAGAFRKKGVRILAQDSDELAVLTVLDRPIFEMVRTVLEHRAIISEIGGFGRQATFELAVSTTALELSAEAGEVSLLVGVKSLQDIYAIMAQVTATAAAFGAAGAT
jgi:hypothetical protein